MAQAKLWPCTCVVFDWWVSASLDKNNNKVVAYELLGTPDKRAAFDDFGDLNAGDGKAGAEAFETEWEFEKFGRAESGHAVFYAGHSLITTLTEVK